jgi:hypothetical protein
VAGSLPIHHTSKLPLLLLLLLTLLPCRLVDRFPLLLLLLLHATLPTCRIEVCSSHQAFTRRSSRACTWLGLLLLLLLGCWLLLRYSCATAQPLLLLLLLLLLQWWWLV